MKKIRLKSVHYINWKGITLTSTNPSIDATEENIEKLNVFIKTGKLEIIDAEQNAKQDKETIVVVDKPLRVLDEQQKKDEEINITIERIRLYSSEELKAMNKADLLALCEERKLDVKKNMSVAKIEELILKNQ